MPKGDLSALSNPEATRAIIRDACLRRSSLAEKRRLIDATVDDFLNELSDDRRATGADAKKLRTRLLCICEVELRANPKPAISDATSETGFVMNRVGPEPRGLAAWPRPSRPLDHAGLRR
jgi:hypothetical protein